MLIGNIQARSVPVKVGDFDTDILLPSGQTLDKRANNAGVDAGTYQSGLQKAITSSMFSQGYNMDRVSNVSVQANSSGAQTMDYTVTVEQRDPNTGIVSANHFSVPNSVVVSQAKADYADLIAGQREQGESMAGAEVASYYDHSRRGYQTVDVQGPNSVGMNAHVFNGAMSLIMQNEGFKSSKSNGSVGYGWHEASGDAIPDTITQPQAQAKLKELLETRYVPMMRGYLKDAGIEPGEMEGTLLDLTYERPADAKQLTTLMGQYKRGEVKAGDVLDSLRKMPSFQDAGGDENSRRNVERRKALQNWLWYEGHPQRASAFYN